MIIKQTFIRQTVRAELSASNFSTFSLQVALKGLGYCRVMASICSKTKIAALRIHTSLGLALLYLFRILHSVYAYRNFIPSMLYSHHSNKLHPAQLFILRDYINDCHGFIIRPISTSTQSKTFLSTFCF